MPAAHPVLSSAVTDDGRTCVLRLLGVSKTFPGTKALDGVDLDLQAGEAHALVGHNGSGKSTLIKCLSGYHRPDPGAQLWWHDELADLSSLADDVDRIRFVHQSLGLVRELSVVDNLALRAGARRGRLGAIDRKAEAREADRLIRSFGVELDPRRPLSEATPVEQTIVAIAIALHGWNPEGGVLVLDEPTAVLAPSESARLFDVIRHLRTQGAAILYVSHRLQEVFDLCSRVTVLRGGRLVASTAVASLTPGDLVELMLGSGTRSEYRAAVQPPRTVPVLEVENLCGRFLKGASFSLHEGEVLGIAGLVDDGRTELPRILSDGVPYPVAGRVRAASLSDEWWDIRAWSAESVALVPPDRAKEGVIPQMSVAENLTLSTLGKLGRRGFLRKRLEQAAVDKWVGQLDVQLTHTRQPLRTLSGGNQQKVLIGRSLARTPQVLVMCEPTAGVDIGSRHAIFDLIAARAAEGLGVIVSSTDVDDLIGVCTRVLVLRDGRVAGELVGDVINDERLVHAMEGFVNVSE